MVARGMQQSARDSLPAVCQSDVDVREYPGRPEPQRRVGGIEMDKTSRLVCRRVERHDERRVVAAEAFVEELLDACWIGLLPIERAILLEHHRERFGVRDARDPNRDARRARLRGGHMYIWYTTDVALDDVSL